MMKINIGGPSDNTYVMENRGFCDASVLGLLHFARFLAGGV